MLTYTYISKGKFGLVEKPKPQVLHERDAIVKVTLASICSSDLHIKHGSVPRAVEGITVGHEMVGIVEEVGSAVTHVKVGDRVTVNVETFCGECFFCKKGFVNNCTDRNGGWALGCRIDGGQAEYVRVPFADQGGIKKGRTLLDPSVRAPDCSGFVLALFSDHVTVCHSILDRYGLECGVLSYRDSLRILCTLGCGFRAVIGVVDGCACRITCHSDLIGSAGYLRICDPSDDRCSLGAGLRDSVLRVGECCRLTTRCCIPLGRGDRHLICYVCSITVFVGGSEGQPGCIHILTCYLCSIPAA